MILLRFLSVIGIMILSVLFITQILIPFITASVLFPAFRKSREHLLMQKAELTAQIADVELESNVVSLQQKLAEKKVALRATNQATSSQSEQKS